MSTSNNPPTERRTINLEAHVVPKQFVCAMVTDGELTKATKWKTDLTDIEIRNLSQSLQHKEMSKLRDRERREAEQEKKTLYHSELAAMGPVRVTVKTDRMKSRYSKPGNEKPDYVVLLIAGKEKNYNTENEGCAAFFEGQKGKTFTLEMAILDYDLEDL